MEIAIDDVKSDDVIELLKTHMQVMVDSSPPGGCHFLDLEGLRQEDVTFWRLHNNGALIGCGALKRHTDDLGEIKSMHIREVARGSGAASHLLKHIISYAKECGLSQLKLETGNTPPFKAAIALYEKHGFSLCQPFADYSDNNFSVFMSKDI